MTGSPNATQPTPDISGVAGKRGVKTCFLIVYFFLSVFTLLNFLEVSLLGDHYYGHGSRVSFEGLNNGTSWKPFVYRLLVPKLTRTVTEMTPTSWRESINDGLYGLRTSSIFVSLKTAMPWLTELFPNKHTIYPRIICILIVYGSLLGFMVMLQKIRLL